MTVRFLSAALAMTLLSACSQGQKARNTEMKSTIDSVSYAIGADIGANLKRSKMDSLNVDLMAMGLQDGLDSAVKIEADKLQAVMQGYMMKMQAKRQAEEQAAGEVNRVAGETFLAENGKRAGVVTTPSGLQYEVITMGTGPKPTETDQVKVHYTGTLIDGKVFDSSVERGEPAVFGVGQVIRGWVEGLQLMPTGSKWKLFIPSDLAYGPSGGPGGSIPGNSTLIFEVELLEIVK
ncbi:MAG TPA: FKBP-type peptidyl-prolyl cis-trans isomerase [Flavobacteriales bacterium]|nr:FKBP-type peptidyl-prolyl cis-trans isomerase [Flavobacteriales bacterium]